MYKVKIERRNSPYNKYIKWFAVGVSESGAKFNFGYRTKKEAIEKHTTEYETIVAVD